MVRASVIIGRTDAGVIICTPPPAIAKTIVSAPGLAFASRIACRSEPPPVSFVFVTVKGDATARREARNARDAHRARVMTPTNLQPTEGGSSRSKGIRGSREPHPEELKQLGLASCSPPPPTGKEADMTLAPVVLGVLSLQI